MMGAKRDVRVVVCALGVIEGAGQWARERWVRVKSPVSMRSRDGQRGSVAESEEGLVGRARERWVRAGYRAAGDIESVLRPGVG